MYPRRVDTDMIHALPLVKYDGELNSISSDNCVRDMSVFFRRPIIIGTVNWSISPVMLLPVIRFTVSERYIR